MDERERKRIALINLIYTYDEDPDWAYPVIENGKLDMTITRILARFHRRDFEDVSYDECLACLEFCLGIIMDRRELHKRLSKLTKNEIIELSELMGGKL